MNSLKDASNKLDTDIRSFTTELSTMSTALEDVKIILDMPDRLENKLGEIEDMLGTVHRILVAISIISVISDAVNIIDKPIKAMEDITEQQRDIVSEFDNKLEVVRQRIEELKERIDHLTYHMNTFEVRYLNAVKLIIAGNVNSVVGDTIAFSNLISTAIKEALPSMIESGKMSKQVTKKCQVINSVEINIKKMMTRLDLLRKLCDPVYKALNHKIHIQFPCKVKVRVKKTKQIKNWKSAVKFVWRTVHVWEWQWVVKNKAYSYNINEIMNGIEGAVSGVHEMLEEEAMKILQPLLKELHLESFDISEIYGLGKAEERFSSLREALNGDLYETINRRFDSVVDKMPKLDTIISQFVD